MKPFWVTIHVSNHGYISISDAGAIADSPRSRRLELERFVSLSVP